MKDTEPKTTTMSAIELLARTERRVRLLAAAKGWKLRGRGMPPKEKRRESVPVISP